MASGLAAAATVALAFAGYASRLVPGPQWLLAVLLVVGAGAMNLVGVREASRANAVFTLVEAAGLVVVIVLGGA